MKEAGTPLKEFPVTINYGIKTGFNDAFFIDTATKERLIREDPRSAELIRPMLRGRDIVPYGAEWDDLWLIYVPWHFPLHLDPNIQGASEVAEKEFSANYPAIYNHLIQFKDRLSARNKVETGIRYEWYALQRWGSNYYEDFAKPKIMYPNMTSVFPFMLDSSGFVSNDKSFIMTANDDSVSLPFLTAVLNSSPAKLWIWYNCPELMGGTREIRKVYFENFPVPPADAAQTAALASLAEQRTAKTAELQKLRHDFTRLVVTNFPGVKLTSVLSGLETLDFPTFLKELNRQKRRPSLQQQNEWADYIEEQTAAARALTAQIALLDAEVDKEVKALYGI